MTLQEEIEKKEREIFEKAEKAFNNKIPANIVDTGVILSDKEKDFVETALKEFQVLSKEEQERFVEEVLKTPETTDNSLSAYILVE